MKNILVIGLGHFGNSLVEELLQLDVEIIVVEEDQKKADLIKDRVDQVIVADATNKDVLEKFAKDVDCAIVCLSERIDSSVLITYHLKELNIKKIIAKATTKDHGRILKSIGADEVIFPEEETARRLAKNLFSKDILDIIKLSGDYDIIEMPVNDEFIKKSIMELDLRKKYNIDILVIRNALSGESNIMPSADYVFQADDSMIFIGTSQSVSKLQGE